MNVKELTKEQKSELKITYLQELLDEAKENRNPSYGEMYEINNIIPDEDLYERYKDVEFENDDFFCTANQD